MSDNDHVRQLLDDALVILKANNVNAPLTIERIEEYLSRPQPKPILKPCPGCNSPTVSIGSQNLKVCSSCGWEDSKWMLDDNQKPMYG